MWWDPKLRAGDDFDKIIEARLERIEMRYRSLEQKSVQSDYVRAEASEAMGSNKKLVPVAIENVTLSFRFKRLHTPMLLNWDGSNESVEFRKLVDDIKAKIGEPTSKTRKAQTSKRRRPVTPPPINSTTVNLARYSGTRRRTAQVSQR